MILTQIGMCLIGNMRTMLGYWLKIQVSCTFSSFVWTTMSVHSMYVLHLRIAKCYCRAGLVQAKLCPCREQLVEVYDSVNWVFVSHLTMLYQMMCIRAYIGPDRFLLIWGTCSVSMTSIYRSKSQYRVEQWARLSPWFRIMVTDSR